MSLWAMAEARPGASFEVEDVELPAAAGGWAFWNGLVGLEMSAFRWLELFRSIFSRPRSSRRARTMAWISAGARSGVEQNVHGPIPSFTQMILPQLRQLGAAARRGWRVAWQVQRRFAFSEADWGVRDGFV